MTTAGTICLSFHMGCSVQGTHEHTQQMGAAAELLRAGAKTEPATNRLSPEPSPGCFPEEGLKPAPHPLAHLPDREVLSSHPSALLRAKHPSLCLLTYNEAASTNPRVTFGPLKHKANSQTRSPLSLGLSFAKNQSASLSGKEF